MLFLYSMASITDLVQLIRPEGMLIVTALDLGGYGKGAEIQGKGRVVDR